MGLCPAKGIFAFPKPYFDIRGEGGWRVALLGKIPVPVSNILYILYKKAECKICRFPVLVIRRPTPTPPHPCQFSSVQKRVSCMSGDYEVIMAHCKLYIFPGLEFQTNGLGLTRVCFHMVLCINMHYNGTLFLVGPPLWVPLVGVAWEHPAGI